MSGFSLKSRSALRFLAENTEHPLISQFALTYHEDWPTDGRIAKAHLNSWLTYLRKHAPGIQYLWILEFQQRNAPHYHVFLSIPPDLELWGKLASSWTSITNGTDDQLWFHGPDRGENWINWTMESANYLTKYLDKESQKFIPPGYVNFGRFWGNSRALKPKPRRIIPCYDLAEFDRLNVETGEYSSGESTVIRWLGRLAERQTKGYSRFRTRAPVASYTMRRGAAALSQIETHLRKGGPDETKALAD